MHTLDSSSIYTLVFSHFTCCWKNQQRFTLYYRLTNSWDALFVPRKLSDLFIYFIWCVCIILCRAYLKLKYYRGLLFPLHLAIEFFFQFVALLRLSAIFIAEFRHILIVWIILCDYDWYFEINETQKLLSAISIFSNIPEPFNPIIVLALISYTTLIIFKMFEFHLLPKFQLWDIFFVFLFAPKQKINMFLRLSVCFLIFISPFRFSFFSNMISARRFWCLTGDKLCLNLSETSLLAGAAIIYHNFKICQGI